MSEEPTLGEILSRALTGEVPPIFASARGNISGHRLMADATYRDSLTTTGAERLADLAQALAFARLAAVGGAEEDERACVFLYAKLSDACRDLGDYRSADALEGRGLLLAEEMAEQGNDEMADMIASRAALMPVGALLEAKRLRETALSQEN